MPRSATYRSATTRHRRALGAVAAVAAAASPLLAAVPAAAAVGSAAIGSTAARSAAVTSAAVPAAVDSAVRAASTGSVLPVWGQLRRGQRLVNGTTTLTMQTDGDLVLRAGPSVVMWHTDTRGRGVFANLKPNNQLVVRDSRSRIIWASPPRSGSPQGLVVDSGGLVYVKAASRMAWSTGTAVKGFAVASLSARGWSSAQWPCLQALWQRESNWNPAAQNRSSGAFGIPQALPGNKMASAGADWRTNYRTQITWGLGYIADRYGSPCGAWSHSQRYGWYSVPTLGASATAG